MERKRFQPDYKEGEIALDKDFQLEGGYKAHVTVAHGDPFGIPEGLRRLEQRTRLIWTYDGFTAEQMIEDLELYRRQLKKDGAPDE